MKKFSVKSFPWSPGIPWKVRRGKYVIPELPAELVSNVLRGKEAVVCSFGGLLESFYSLSILETMNKNLLAKKLYWAGNNEYEPLVAANSLAQPFYDASINSWPYKSHWLTSDVLHTGGRNFVVTIAGLILVVFVLQLVHLFGIDIGFLAVYRYRIMDSGMHTLVGQECFQFIPVIHTHSILMVNIVGPGDSNGQLDVCSSNAF